MVVDYPLLKRLSFSQYSFQQSKNCIIRDCKELTSIEFDDYSFHEMSGIFELSNLPSLHYLDISKLPLKNISEQIIESKKTM